MKSNEFRIGNLLQTNQEVFKVTGIQDEGLWLCPFLSDESFSPEYKDITAIPLTEEWLLKFGFKEMNRDDCFEKMFLQCNDEHKSRLAIYLKGDSWNRNLCDLFNTQDDLSNANWEQCSINSNIDYVHQLQNLYFALTGEELKPC